jgi:hypothetical protein
MKHASKISTLEETNGWLQSIAGRLASLEHYILERRFKEVEAIRCVLGISTDIDIKILKQEIWNEMRAKAVLSGMLTAEELQSAVDKLERKGKVRRKSKRKAK